VPHRKYSLFIFSVCVEQKLDSFLCRNSFFFLLVGYEALYGFWGTLLRSAGPVIGGLLRGGGIGAVDIVVVRDSSSALSLSHSLSASSVIFWRVKCDARESFAPFPFYFGLRYIVWTLWNCLGIFCFMGNIAQFGPLYPLLSRLHYIFELLLASSFFSHLISVLSPQYFLYAGLK
jgi:hypothetical protein